MKISRASFNMLFLTHCPLLSWPRVSGLGAMDEEASGDEPGGTKSLSDSFPWLDKSGDWGESRNEHSERGGPQVENQY